LAAIVDHKNYGIYSDPESQLFVDYNDDGLFGDDEAVTRGNGAIVKSGTKKLKADWGSYPAQLIIGGK
jgi:hypothetical protein